MKFLDLKDISERGMELINPTSTEKVLKIGEVATGGRPCRVIDFGSGTGEVLALWAEHFDISGVGIDVRPKACERARLKLAQRGLSDRIEIACMDGANYPFEPHTFDVAACIGATFIWGGFQPALQRLREAITPTGRLAVGEAYWRVSNVPPDFSRKQTSIWAEYELFHMAWAEGLEVEYVIRASQDDWDRYEAGNWRGLLAWIAENPDHPEKAQVLQHLHESQDEYARLAREYFGWAMYVLKPGADLFPAAAQ